MAEPIFTIEELAAILRRSGLTNLEPDDLVAKYREGYLPESHLPDSITAFCDFLVRNQIATVWQCSKLRKRQYKGFFVDRFLLLDLVGNDDTSSYYLARELDGKRRHVRLSVIPPFKEGGPVRFRVVETFD